MERIILVFVCFLSIVNGLYIKSDQLNTSDLDNKHDHQESYDKFADITSSWLKYKQKLQSIKEIKGFTSPKKDKFNEIEVLELIPQIIDHYRSGKINQNDEEILSEIYGNLWTIIVKEAKRQSNEEMDPVLKALLDSFYLTKDSTTNDVDKNTVDKIPKKISKPRNKLLLRIDRNDHPAQRILNTAAMLIHYDRNAQHIRHHRDVTPQLASVKSEKDSTPRTATLNLQINDFPIESIKKSKRHVQIYMKGHEFVNSRIDALLKMNGKLYADDDYDDGDSEYADDYEDDNILSMGKRNKLDNYEDNYEYDEKANAPISNPDYGSFRDLIFLAAKHRLRREKEEMKMKTNKRHLFSLSEKH